MTEEERRKWLDGLKVGSAVVVSAFGNLTRETVSRTTKTEIHAGNLAFRRKGGHRIGLTRWCTGGLLKPTKQLLRKMDEDAIRRQLRESLGEVAVHNLPITTVRQILALLKQAKEEK